MLDGNVSEPQTFEVMLDDVASQRYTIKEKPVVVMDAGIATEDNIEIVKQKKYDYICVNKAGGGKIYTKLCTRPNPDLSAMYSALSFKERPFVRKSKVVTQQQK